MSDTCNICEEKYNRTNRKKIKCICGHECCRTCFKTYILSKLEEPSCMKCKMIYSRGFLCGNLEKTFINNEYKELKQNILYEKEKALFPITQVYIEKENEIIEIKNKIRKIDEDNAPFRKEIKDINNEINALKRKRDDINLIISESRYEKNDLLSDLYRLQRNLNEIDANHLIQKCPNEHCNGFLDEHYMCGLCDKKFCNKCRVDITSQNSSQNTHVCDENIIKNIEYIKKQIGSKPCPKCNVDISKVDGCDDLYCTACKTFFKWNSLKIIHKKVHNPEYEKERRNGENSRREIGDILCGRELSQIFIHELLRKITFGPKIYKIEKYTQNPDFYKNFTGFRIDPFNTKKKLVSYYVNENEFKEYKLDPEDIKEIFYSNETDLHKIMISIDHMREVYIDKLLRNNNDNLKWRKSYLRNEITIEKFKFEIQKRNKKYEFKMDQAVILDTFVSTSIDLLYRLNVNTNEKQYDKIMNELDYLREITNDFLHNSAQNYEYTPLFICEDYCVHSGFSY